MNNITKPLSNVKWVNRDSLKANNYNPNVVSSENLKLLTNSIFVNGFTQPIVIRPDGVIIDGFHRWTVSGKEWTYKPEGKQTLYEILEGKVPVVIVEHDEHSKNVYGTITHNRARGTHQLAPMKAIVKELINEGKTIDEIGKQLGMKKEEVFRLSDFSREDFLSLMSTGHSYSKAELVTKY